MLLLNHVRLEEYFFCTHTILGTIFDDDQKRQYIFEYVPKLARIMKARRCYPKYKAIYIKKKGKIELTEDIGK